MSKFYKLAILICLFFSGAAVMAQDDEEEIDWNERLKVIMDLEEPVYKPVVGLGSGMMSFYGDVNDDNIRDFAVGQQGFNIDIMRVVNPFYTFGFRFMYGTLQGEQFSTDPNARFNFQSQMMTFGFNLQYNFSHLKFIGQHNKRRLTPFVQLGLEFMNFETMGDYGLSKDIPYYYWSDGTIRLVEELPENALSPAIQRDYDYEVSLTDRNIDDTKSSSMNIGIPIDIGLNFTISPKVSFRVGYSYHLALSDKIDDISTKGQNYDIYPERKGKAGGDNFSYSYVSLNLDLFSQTTEERQLQFLELEGDVFDFWDMDGDFVMDEYDECPFTKAGVPVDSLGCPFDADADGVPDHLDQEENTRSDAFLVDENGVEVTEEIMLAQLNDKESFNQEDIYKYYPSLLQGTGLYRQFYKEIPEKFNGLDNNNDGYISVDEFFKAVDSFFDSDDMTVDDLQELNEFFFMQ